MATNNDINLEFTEENVQAAQDILSDIKQKATQAHENGDLFTLNLLEKLLGLVSPIVVAAQARLEREENARLRRKHKELKARAREQREASRP